MAETTPADPPDPAVARLPGRPDVPLGPRARGDARQRGQEGRRVDPPHERLLVPDRADPAREPAQLVRRGATSGPTSTSSSATPRRAGSPCCSRSGARRAGRTWRQGQELHCRRRPPTSTTSRSPLASRYSGRNLGLPYVGFYFDLERAEPHAVPRTRSSTPHGKPVAAAAYGNLYKAGVRGREGRELDGPGRDRGDLAARQQPDHRPACSRACRRAASRSSSEGQETEVRRLGAPPVSDSNPASRRRSRESPRTSRSPQLPQFEKSSTSCSSGRTSRSG